MGNKGSREKSRGVQPEIRASRNPIIFNTIEVKPAEEVKLIDNSKCKTCDKKGKEFTVASRDGTTFTKMYYCRTCSNHWRD
jgi:hypothetical protein